LHFEVYRNELNCGNMNLQKNANINLKKIVFNVMYENGRKIIDILINVENILKCDPIFLKKLYNMSKLVFWMHMVFDIAYHKVNFIIN
jgi:hypothetical protein